MALAVTLTGAVVGLGLLVFAAAGRAQPRDTAPPEAAPAAPSPGGLPPGGAPALYWPAACELGRSCLIQNHFDHGPPGEVEDWRCGGHGRDGHRGTDIRLPARADMAESVAVLAAAPGRVVALHDGMPDGGLAQTDPAELAGQEDGNRVVLAHGQGWRTAYTHLRRGSVAVALGDRVETGDRLGAIGMSGLAEFPQLGFELSRDRQPVDPFVGPIRGWRCGEPRRPLWAPDISQDLSYRPAAVLGLGWATSRPERLAASRGEYDGLSPLPRGADGLVLWARVMGVRAGDVARFEIAAPDGRTILEDEREIDRDYAAWFGFAGRRPPGGLRARWPAGQYVGHWALTREAETLARASTVIEIRQAPPAP